MTIVIDVITNRVALEIGDDVEVAIGAKECGSRVVKSGAASDWSKLVTAGHFTTLE